MDMVVKYFVFGMLAAVVLAAVVVVKAMMRG